MTLSLVLIVVLMLSLGLGAFFLYIALWSRRRKSGADKLELRGMKAWVSTALDPEGAIILDGELWRARVMQDTAVQIPGYRVRVVGVDGHFLVVEPTE